MEKKKITEKEAIVSLATPNGISSIAVIKISGKKSIDIVNKIFKGKNLKKEKKNTTHFEIIKEKKKIIDEVIVSIFKKPASFTKEDCIEISCHGSIFIIKNIITLLIKNGARIAKPGEFTKRAFLNGQMDLIQAEAISDLVYTESEMHHKISISQMRGNFSEKIKKLRKKLVNFSSMIELELDFSEENIKFLNKKKLKSNINEILKYIKPIIKSFSLGNVIKNGIPIIIVGKVNSGKSTLMNLLMNEEKSIVSNIKGTTRDIIEDELIIEGIKFKIIDTAGLRKTEEKIEKIGIKKTKEKIKKSSIIIYIFDLLKENLENVEKEIKKFKKLKIPIIKVGNKVDKIKSKEHEKENEIIKISAKKNINIEELKLKIMNIINIKKIKNSSTIVINERHYENLKKIEKSLKNIIHNIEENITNDIISIDIRMILYLLGEITGEITTEDLLKNIFSKFCIGK